MTRDSNGTDSRHQQKAQKKAADANGTLSKEMEQTNILRCHFWAGIGIYSTGGSVVLHAIGIAAITAAFAALTGKQPTPCDNTCHLLAPISKLPRGCNVQYEVPSLSDDLLRLCSSPFSGLDNKRSSVW